MPKDIRIEMLDFETKPQQKWLTEEVAHFSHEMTESLHLQVGNRPFARSLSKIYENSDRELPEQLKGMKGEIYLITHAVGMLAEEKANRIQQIGYQASFTDPGATVELFPNTRFKDWITASLKFESSISADGYAKSPDLVRQLKDVINLGAGAELKLGTEANFVGRLSLSVKTPIVQAVGNASSHVNWQFDKDSEPLVGDQIMVQTVVVPRGQETLTYNIQGYAVVDPSKWPWGTPVRFETTTRKVEVALTE